MKILLISVLLFFEICSGFSIRKIQQIQPQPDGAENPTEVYEVREENRSTIRIVYPKRDKPTLREIIYYHIIETPYGETENTEESEGIDFEKTTRSFTNSHGYQYFNENPDDTEDKTITIFDYSDDIIEVDDGSDSIEDNADADLEKVNEDSQKDTIREEAATRVQEEKEHSTEKNEAEDKEVATEEAVEEKTVPSIGESFETATTRTDEHRNARNVLFSEARNKYLVKAKSKSTRSKRASSIKDMPPAPTLPPFNLDVLPEYIRKIMQTTPKPETTTPKGVELTHFNEHEFKEELEHKIEDMISSLKPKDIDEEDGDDGEDDDDEDDDDDNDEDDDDEWDIEDTVNKRVPRTYGMKLTMGRGYVWNDLISEPGMPGMSFDVGEPEVNVEENKEESTEHHERTEKPEVITTPKATEKPVVTDTPDHTEPFTNVPHPTESTPIDIEELNLSEVANKDHDKETDNKNENHVGTTIHEDLEDIEITSHKLKLLPDEEDSSEKKHNKGSHAKDNKKDEHKEDKPLTFDMNEYKEHEHVIEENKERLPEPQKKSIDNHSIKDTEKNKHKNNKKHKDSFKELMKNDEFWKWLSDWTAMYMELLMKHIKNMVHDEVARQVKTLAANIKKDFQADAKETNDKKDKEQSDDTKNNSEKEDTEKKESVSSHDSTLANHIYEEEHGKPDAPKHDDGKLIIDGKEIPITPSTNFDLDGQKKKYDDSGLPDDVLEFTNDLSRHRKHRDDKEKPKETAVVDTSSTDSNKSINVRAKNIFGNAAGSDQVTNIFIFYPNKDDDIADRVKPIANGTNNIYAFGSNDNVEIDQRHPEITGQKDESTMTEPEKQNKPNPKPYKDIPEPNVTTDKDMKENEHHVENNQESHTEPTELKVDLQEKEEIKTTTALHAVDNSKKEDKLKDEDNKNTELPEEKHEENKIDTEKVSTEVEKAPNKDTEKEDKPLDTDNVTEIPKKVPGEDKVDIEDDVKKEIENKIGKDLSKVIEKELNKELIKEIKKELEKSDKSSTIKQKHKDNKNTELPEEKREEDIIGTEGVNTEVEKAPNKEIEKEDKPLNIAEIPEKVAEEGKVDIEDEVKKDIENKIEKDLSKVIEKEQNKELIKEMEKEFEKSDKSSTQEEEKSKDKSAREDSDKKDE